MPSDVYLITCSENLNFLDFIFTSSSCFAAAILFTYFFLIENKLISGFAASARSSEFGLRSGQSPIQLDSNHHLVLCSKAGSNDLAHQHCSITCFLFHSRVCFIFLQTLKHYSSSLFLRKNDAFHL